VGLRRTLEISYFIIAVCSLAMYVYTTVVHFPFSGFGGCIHIHPMCIPMHAMHDLTVT
jgi:hypothetical protein